MSGSGIASAVFITALYQATRGEVEPEELMKASCG
jgi:hypothetical protein